MKLNTQKPEPIIIRNTVHNVSEVRDLRSALAIASRGQLNTGSFGHSESALAVFEGTSSDYDLRSKRNNHKIV